MSKLLGKLTVCCPRYSPLVGNAYQEALLPNGVKAYLVLFNIRAVSARSFLLRFATLHLVVRMTGLFYNTCAAGRRYLVIPLAPVTLTTERSAHEASEEGSPRCKQRTCHHSLLTHFFSECYFGLYHFKHFTG